MTTEQLKSEVERGNVDAIPAYALSLARDQVKQIASVKMISGSTFANDAELHCTIRAEGLHHELLPQIIKRAVNEHYQAPSHTEQLKTSIANALYYLRLGETGRATEILNQALSS